MRFVKTMAVALVLTMITGTAVFADDSIDDMTIEELREAYQELEEENKVLQEQVEDLKAQLSNTQNGKGEKANTADRKPADRKPADRKPVPMTTEEFLKDIVDSYNGRSAVADKYTTAEKVSMSDADFMAFNIECARSEQWFYDKYKNASFEDLNIQYLCGQYISGLDKQYRSGDIYKENTVLTEANDVYQSGYYDRAYVIVELSEYYDAPFEDISGMKEDTAAMDLLNEAETRNASVDHARVKKTQELLNGIGFYCGTADGVSGNRTVKSIKRFQTMYEYEPADGIIDDELIEQLQKVYDEKKLTKEETDKKDKK